MSPRLYRTSAAWHIPLLQSLLLLAWVLIWQLNQSPYLFIFCALVADVVLTPFLLMALARPMPGSGPRAGEEAQLGLAIHRIEQRLVGVQDTCALLQSQQDQLLSSLRARSSSLITVPLPISPSQQAQTHGEPEPVCPDDDGREEEDAAPGIDLEALQES